jgi:hypothetical protein
VGKRLRKEKEKGAEEGRRVMNVEGPYIPMQWYCRRRSSLPLLVQAYIIIAYLYYSATLLVVAQEAQVENPCLICPYGATQGDDYAPYASYEDPITCKEIINDAKLFETGSFWCAQYEEAGLNYCCPTTTDDPCNLCPNGITVADDYDPYNNGYTCSDWLDLYATDFDAKSASCTVGRRVLDIKSHCCPSVANNPCIICPGGATAGEDIVPSAYDKRTCEDLIEAALTFDAESEMCLVHVKKDEDTCCPSSTTAINDYCNICPNGITAGYDFIPWSESVTCKDLVQNAKLYENGSVGCNFQKGYEMSCCPRAGTVSENTNTPSSATTSIPTISPTIGKPDTLYIVEVTAAIVGAVAALVGAAFALARWKNKNLSSAVPTTAATSPNIMTSSIPIVTATAVPQSANVYNNPMLSQPNELQGPRRSSLVWSRSFSSRI